ncbi:MAG: type II secretion system protein [Desulfobacula sp.]|jgi:prepilin-type N-terminal cleavage/methylation domain-containing protein|nr:type II secretion system protein [Desulfobacula sp.]
MKLLKPRAMENGRQQGFTLIEILIVVMVLGILAMIIVPQITVSTSDAKKSTLVTNLGAMRNAIELYYHQHNNIYPGFNKDDGGAGPTAGEAATAFVKQLTQYTDADGKVAAVYDATTAKFGPYLKSASLPANPFNDLTSVLCDVAEDDITVRAASGTEGWKFYTITGNFIANIAAYEAL